MTVTSPPSLPDTYEEAMHRLTPEYEHKRNRQKMYDELLGIVPKRFHNAKPEHLIGDLANWDERGAFIAGPVGSGKTHQAAALLLKHWESFWITEAAIYGGKPAPWLTHRLDVRWVNVPLMLEQIRKSFDFPDVAPDECQDAGLLVLDDLGAEKSSEWVEERLYCIVNFRYEKDLPTIVTSNMGLNDLGKSIGQRTASRLSEMCAGFLLADGDRRRSR